MQNATVGATSHAPTLEQRALMRLWKANTLVDYFVSHDQLFLEAGWKPGKVVSCTATPCSSSVVVVLHQLGSSSHDDEEVLISPGEMPLRVAAFGSKSSVFEEEGAE
jgi:hypothetical protein